MATPARHSSLPPFGALAPGTAASGPMTGSGPGAVDVEVLHGTEGWSALQDAWRALYDVSRAEPSSACGWAQAVAEHWVDRPEAVRTIVLRRGATLVGVVPLLLAADVRTHRQLTPLAEAFTTHSDWLVAEASPAVAAAFAAGVEDLDLGWDRLRMVRVPDHHPFLPLAVAALEQRGFASAVRASSASYRLDLPRTYEAYLDARSAKFRNHLRRVEKRLAASASIAQVAGVGAAAEVDRLVDDALAVERASWKQTGGVSIAADARAAAFWRAVCRHAGARGHLHLQVLRVGTRPVAYNLGILRRGRYSYIKTTTRADALASGAATYLRTRLVDDLIARGASMLDFAGEPGAWEHQWTHDRLPRSTLTVFAPTVRGRALRWYERLRHGTAAPPWASPSPADPRAD